MRKWDDNAGGVFFGGERSLIPHLMNSTRLVRRLPHRAHIRYPRQWSMDYHVEAAGEFSLDGHRWRPREAHTAHLYSAGCAYWERSTPADVPFHETYIIFSIEDSRDLDPLVGPGQGFSRFLDPEGLLAAAFAHLAGSGGATRSWRGQADFYAILDLLLAAQPMTGADRLITAGIPLPSRQLAEHVEAQIREHYHEPLTLIAMARKAGVSVSTLTHRYRVETGGRTPIGRLIEHRLDVARGMLLKGTSLKAVVAHTGFYDEFHLSKAFKRRFGFPPRRYTRLHAAGEIHSGQTDQASHPSTHWVRNTTTP